MNRRIDKLEARTRALCTHNTIPLLLVPLETGITHMTIAEYNAAGGMLKLPFWTNPNTLNLKASKSLLDTVPTVDMTSICHPVDTHISLHEESPALHERNHNLI